jgi:TRAP transporter TAXI family solute receptor
MKKLLLIIPFVALFLVPGNPAAARTKFVTIGTGGVTGVYYPTGGAISSLVNKKRKEYGLKVTVEATGGSVFNINALVSGDMELALAQSDRVTQAWKGVVEWKKTGPCKDLRGVLTLHSETVCLIAAVKSGIRKCSDLKGKIVAIGNPGSGTRQNSLDAMSTCGLKISDPAKAEQIKAAEAAGLLQDGRLDAYFYTVGHPNGSIKEAAAGRTKVRFVPLPDSDRLIAEKPFYSKAVIPVRFYPGVENKKDVPSFGVKACLITTTKVPEEVVYAVTKEVFENFDTFRKLHPAFSTLKKKEMVQGMPIPFHRGAIKYFEEAGLAEYVKRK